MKKILVVVDMQNDFIDGALGTPEAVGIVDNVCKKIREGEWDVVYATMDWHNVPEYYESQEGKKLPILHCLERTEGCDLNTDVEAVLDTCDIIYKDTFGTCNLAESINQDCRTWNMRGRWNKSNLEITLVGVCTDICVVTNALLLKTYFPEARIVVDASCCAGTTPEMHQKALDVMRSCQVDVENEYADTEEWSAGDWFKAERALKEELRDI